MSDAFNPDQFDPHDPAYLADPYPTYTSFREQAPIHTVQPYAGNWLFAYDDCQQVLDDTAVWIKHSPGDPKPYGQFGMMASFPPGLFGSDPPLHTKLRGILEPLFDKAIETAPAIAGQLAEPLLAAAHEHGRMELISDYALPLPAQVLFTLLGIPNQPGVWSGLMSWQAAIVAAHDITQSAAVRGGGATCSMALNSFFEGLLLSDDATLKTGLFGEICRAFADAHLTPQQVQMCATDFLVAGYISTTFLIGTGTRNLLRNPEQLEALRNDDTLIDGAVEEMLRFDAPAQLVDRCAAFDTTLGGHDFKAGDRIALVLGSADRDPKAFDNPDQFLINRDPVAHLSFGAGIHHCIGAPLVRLVAPVAFKMLLAAFPDLSLDGLPQWQTDPYLRAVSSLPLSF